MAMNRLLPALLLGLSTTLTGSLRAQEPVRPEGAQEKKEPEKKETPKEAPLAAPECADCPQTREIHRSRTQVYIVEQEEATTIPRLTTRAVECGREVRTHLEVDWAETKYSVTELEFKPRTVLQEVVVCSVEPKKSVDPHSGKECTVFEKVESVKKVKVTVYDCVPVEKHYILKTPVIKPVDKEYLVRRLVLDSTTEPGIRKTLRAVHAPEDVKLQVPLTTVPCLTAPCPATGCLSK
jgi:hypothetical protein